MRLLPFLGTGQIEAGTVEIEVRQAGDDAEERLLLQGTHGRLRLGVVVVKIGGRGFSLAKRANARVNALHRSEVGWCDTFERSNFCSTQAESFVALKIRSICCVYNVDSTCLCTLNSLESCELEVGFEFTRVASEFTRAEEIANSDGLPEPRKSEM